MAAAQSIPPRIHVLLAQEAAIGLVIRRGPSKCVCTIGWDRRRDTFQLGQWLRGRIYERRCDLSPDGKHLIYFAMNGRWDSETRGSWTAISRAPYLKAIGLWAKGDCWNGDGLFLNNRDFWLNGGCLGHHPLLVPRPLCRSEDYPLSPDRYGGECPGVYYLRLQRDGWKLLALGQPCPRGQVTIFEKPLDRSWVLRKRAYATLAHPVGKGCYFDEHALENRASGTVLELPAWEWAEKDGQRLVWSEGGKLFTGALNDNGVGPPRLLGDFNGMAFEAIPAPY